MSLIVEDGTGLSNSESYCSETFADTYHENRGNSDWLLVVDKEAALRKATEYMLQVYRFKWTGYRAVSTQALDWPRSMVYLNDYAEEVSISSTIVPTEVKNACAELALKTYTDTQLLADMTDNVVKEIIGPITVQYSDSSADKYKSYSAVNSMLRPYFRSTALRVYR